MHTGPESVLRLIAIAMGLGITAMAGLELQRALESEAGGWPAAAIADLHREPLCACRVLQSTAVEAGNECQVTWAENHCRFSGIDAECDKATDR